MNAAHQFLDQYKAGPERPAIWLPGRNSVSFADLAAMGDATRTGLTRAGIGRGDHVLVFGALVPELYGALLGAMSLGATCVFVEPWMSVARLDVLITRLAPKAFLCDLMGRLWGLRSAGVRRIRQKINLRRLIRGGTADNFVCDRVAPETAAMIALRLARPEHRRESFVLTATSPNLFKFWTSTCTCPVIVAQTCAFSPILPC